MKTFKVYWKYEDNGDNEPVVIAYDRIEMKDNRFILYNENASIAQDGYLSVNGVAAIIPEHQRELRNPIEFRVFLRKRQEPITILANKATIAEGKVQFISIHYDSFSQETNEVIIDGIYIVASEVIAVLPVARLVTRDGQ